MKIKKEEMMRLVDFIYDDYIYDKKIVK